MRPAIEMSRRPVDGSVSESQDAQMGAGEVWPEGRTERGTVLRRGGERRWVRIRSARGDWRGRVPDGAELQARLEREAGPKYCTVPLYCIADLDTFFQFVGGAGDARGGVDTTRSGAD